MLDDGESGGDLKIELSQRNLNTDDGIAPIEGKIHSKSKMLYLGVNGNWVFVGADGKFSSSLPVKQGDSELKFQAKDIAGAKASAKLPVKSAKDGQPPDVEGKRIALFIGICRNM